MNYLKLTDSKLDINRISELVAHESCGAVSLFVGTTRDNFEGKTVIKLEYESYNEMAKKTMLTICNDIRELWPDVKNIAIFHRLGLVPVKEASVVIAISSPHRRESLDAVNYTIEQLKKSVPIFKKEIYKDSENLDSLSDSNIEEPSRKKFKPLNFEDCKVVDHVHVSKNLVQINVDESEIERRIKNFIERKREEIDKNNIKEFLVKTDNPDESTCARVNSMIVRSVNSKGHVKARRVKNEYGPQDDINYKNTLNNFMDREEISNLSVSKPEIPIQPSIAERLENAENFLNIQDCKKSIFERIKLIEDRILYLESISPEYSHFVDKHKNVVNTSNSSSLPSISRSSNPKKSSYPPQILDKLIKDIELKMENK